MKIYKPGNALRHYVRYYWTLKSDEHFSVLTFPIGCTQIIFHHKSPLRIPELDTTQSILTISGQVNFPAHIESDGNLEMIVAVFYPHTIGMFINTPPSAFYNHEISGYDLEDRQLNDVADKIFNCRHEDDCVMILEEWLLSRIRPSVNLDRIGHSLSQLLHDPRTSVGHLAESACLSRKQYERIFRECVGMNPKEYARIVKFQKSMLRMQYGDRNFAGIAAECGYADQSHFIKEFKAMSGHTPKCLPDYCAPYSDLFTTPA